MAEIRIERKRRGLGWLWLFLALVLVAVLAWYFLYPGRTTTAPAAAPPTTGALGAPETHRPAIGALTRPVRRASMILARDPQSSVGGRHSGGQYGKQG
jgi:hypothetical protein